MQLNESLDALQNKAVDIFLAPVLLTFFVLMTITIGTLVVIMQQRGLPVDLSVTWGMSFLALISLLLLIFQLRELEHSPALQNNIPSKVKTIQL